MNWKVTGEQLEIDALESDIFNLGAPFSCFLKGDAWNEETKAVGKLTTSWQPIMYDEINDWYWIYHIDLSTFSDHTFQWYKDQLPEENLSELEQAILNRMPDEQYMEYTPQQYVSEIIIGDNFTVIELP